MNIIETAQALALAQAFDRRTVGEMDVRAWQAILADAGQADVMEAIRQHYAESTDWIMPAHVRRAVRDMVSQRDMAERATPWAPGQYGVLKADAMPEVSGPIDENALTPSVRALLEATRAMLPEGSREALMPRRVAWEKEYAAQERQRKAVPNPHYRPMGQCPGGIMSWTDFDHGGVLRHQDGSFCGGAAAHDQEQAEAYGTGILPNAYRCVDCLFTTASGKLMTLHMEENGHRREGPSEEAKPETTARREGCEWHEEGGYGFVWTCGACVAKPETAAKVHAHRCADCTFTSAKAEVLDHHMARTGHVEGI